MSNEAVEYVRGIPVVKTFGQSVFSFKRFKASIDQYQKWVIAYTLDLRLPMVLYTTLVNSCFSVLIGLTLFVAKDSKVEENGTPSQLTASGGFYKRMQDLQNNALEWNI